MKKTTLLILFCALMIIGAGCKKTKLTGALGEYEGQWESSTTQLELKANGKASYSYNAGGSTKNITNGRLIISGSTMKIKFIFSVTYHIDTPPTEYTTSYGEHFWYMILDGEEFIKYD